MINPHLEKHIGGLSATMSQSERKEVGTCSVCRLQERGRCSVEWINFPHGPRTSRCSGSNQPPRAPGVSMPSTASSALLTKATTSRITAETTSSTTSVATTSRTPIAGLGPIASKQIDKALSSSDLRRSNQTDFKSSQTIMRYSAGTKTGESSEGAKELGQLDKPACFWI